MKSNRILIVLSIMILGASLHAAPKTTEKTYGISIKRLVKGSINAALAVGAGCLAVDSYKYAQDYDSASDKTQKIIAFIHDLYLRLSKSDRKSGLGPLTGYPDTLRERTNIGYGLCALSGLAALDFGLTAFDIFTSGSPIEIVVSEKSSK